MLCFFLYWVCILALYVVFEFNFFGVVSYKNLAPSVWVLPNNVYIYIHCHVLYDETHSCVNGKRL